MSVDVDASSPPVPSPTRAAALRLRWRAMQRSAVLPVTVAAIAALALGLLLGRATGPAVADDAIAVLEREVLPLVVDADGVWTAGTNGLPPVATQLQALRRTGDPAAVEPHVQGWQDAYDTTLRRIVGVEVASDVRPVQRQFVAAVTLSRDAVDLIATASGLADPATRRELTSEALRLRIRSEQLTQGAHAALRDLRGVRTTGVSVPPSVPSLADLR